ncbi:MAG: GNAT family N-acetyltransferase [Casimicrobium sp.]
MPPKYDFRETTPQDATIIAHHAHGWGEATNEDRVTYATWIASAIKRDLYLGVLATHGDVVVAGAGAILFEGGPILGSTNAMRARLSNVFTEPTHRKRGLSQALCMRVIERVRAHDIHMIALACTNDSRHIYERLGFKPYPAEMRLMLREP